MSLTGSRTLIRRSAEQWREIQQRFEHSGQTQVAFCAAEGLALSTFTLWRRKLDSSRKYDNQQRRGHVRSVAGQ